MGRPHQGTRDCSHLSCCAENMQLAGSAARGLTCSVSTISVAAGMHPYGAKCVHTIRRTSHFAEGRTDAGNGSGLFQFVWRERGGPLQKPSNRRRSELPFCINWQSVLPVSCRRVPGAPTQISEVGRSLHLNARGVDQARGNQGHPSIEHARKSGSDSFYRI